MAKKKNVQKRPAINSALAKADTANEKVNVEEILTDSEAKTTELAEIKETETSTEETTNTKVQKEDSVAVETKKAVKKAERESIGQKIRGTKQEISKINWGEPKQVRTTLGAVIAYSLIGAFVMLVTTQIAIKIAEAINTGMVPKAN